MLGIVHDVTIYSGGSREGKRQDSILIPSRLDITKLSKDCVKGSQCKFTMMARIFVLCIVLSTLYRVYRAIFLFAFHEYGNYGKNRGIVD